MKPCWLLAHALPIDDKPRVVRSRRRRAIQMAIQRDASIRKRIEGVSGCRPNILVWAHRIQLGVTFGVMRRADNENGNALNDQWIFAVHTARNRDSNGRLDDGDAVSDEDVDTGDKGARRDLHSVDGCIFGQRREVGRLCRTTLP